MGQPSALCVFAKTCGNSLALEHDGSLYACDHYVYPDYKLGDIGETPLREMLWSDRQAAFGQDKEASLTAQCRACEFRFACNGGCPKHRFGTSKTGEAGHNYFCESYTAFFRRAAHGCEKWLGKFPTRFPQRVGKLEPLGPHLSFALQGAGSMSVRSAFIL